MLPCADDFRVKRGARCHTGASSDDASVLRTARQVIRVDLFQVECGGWEAHLRATQAWWQATLCQWVRCAGRGTQAGRRPQLRFDSGPRCRCRGLLGRVYSYLNKLHVWADSSVRARKWRGCNEALSGNAVQRPFTHHQHHTLAQLQASL
jgi:hypothetical protein